MSALLKPGLHPLADDALRGLGITAGRVLQTVGHAPASAGLHAADGTVQGEPYCAAVDLRSRDLTVTELHQMLDALAAVGFAAWARIPGQDRWPKSEAPHIHAVFVGVPMKAGLVKQVRNWSRGRNGLRSNLVYRFHTWPEARRGALLRWCLAKNPEDR